MRYLVLLLPLAAAGCASYYYPGYAGDYGGYPVYASGYGYETGYYSQPGSGENCGTPDVWKPCPPLPRHPLPYYPANRP
jgi:hypothetical protein